MTVHNRVWAACLLSLLAVAPGLLPGQADGARRLQVRNTAGDITVWSDRKETTRQFFNRHRLVVGGVRLSDVDALLQDKSDASREKVTIRYASFNDDPKKLTTRGTTLDLAPLTAEVRRGLAAPYRAAVGKKTAALTLVLRRDDGKAGLYHVVGWTERGPVNFFGRTGKDERDGFAQMDLRFSGGK